MNETGAMTGVELCGLGWSSAAYGLIVLQPITMVNFPGCLWICRSKENTNLLYFFSEERTSKCSFALYGKVCHVKVSVDEGRGSSVPQSHGSSQKGTDSDRQGSGQKKNKYFIYLRNDDKVEEAVDSGWGERRVAPPGPQLTGPALTGPLFSAA